jgi:DNA polymerase-3 subunit epsilon/ATP-dependent DNA helicase DinG
MIYGGILSEVEERLRGSSVSHSRKQEVIEIAKNGERDVERCRDRVSEFFGAMQDFVEVNVEGMGEYERRLRITNVERRGPRWKKVILVAENLCLALEGVTSGLNRLYTALEPITDLLDQPSLLVELSSVIQFGAELVSRLYSAVYGRDDEGDEKVYWLSLRGDVVTICAAPLHVGSLLGEALFSKKECVVLTSATLSIEGSFDYIEEQLGLEEAGELLLGSSFDYRNAALIYMPDDIPEPGQDGYQQAVAQVLIDLFRATGGKAVALFTSHASLRATYETIIEPLWDKEILVLGQGIDGSPRQLLQALRSNPKVVLLGTTSFWEGVDVVGESLSVLVVMRLPFGVPTDPVYVARSELLVDPFGDRAVPQAVLRFKQGFGRLIRSKTDRGALVVLDRRITSKYYGSAFLKSLPPCEVRSGPVRGMPEEVLQWLRRD